jgi:hypothetical protein
MVENSFEADLKTSLDDFKAQITSEQEEGFSKTSLKDLKEEIVKLQKTQGDVRKVMGLHRIEVFLKTVEQWGKVVDVFANSSIFVAFVWGPVKFVLLVRPLLRQSICHDVPAIRARTGFIFSILSSY